MEGKKYISESVYKEVVEKGLEREEPEVDYIRNLVEEKYFTILKPKELIEEIYPLTEADREVISLALKINATAIIDEEKARQIAELKNIEYHGTLYLIILLVSKKIITKKEALNCIDKMIKSGFYISAELYGETFKLIDKT